MGTEPNQLVQMIVAAITAAGGLKVLIPKLLQWLDCQREKRAISEHQTSLVSMRQVQAMLGQLRYGMNADRVALVRAANGGSTPKPSTPLNVQTLFEQATIPSPTGRIFWLRPQRADGALIDLIGQLGEGKTIDLNVDEMEPGMLHTQAAGMGAAQVLARRVRITSTSSQFLLVFRPTGEEIGAGERLLLDDVVQNIGAKL